MIVVIGSPIGRLVDEGVRAAGMSARVALAAAATGRPVQLVGRTGDDPTADAIVLDLARGGVGHVALLRDPARATPLVAPDSDDETVTDENDLDPDAADLAHEVDARDDPVADAADPTHEVDAQDDAVAAGVPDAPQDVDAADRDGPTAGPAPSTAPPALRRPASQPTLAPALEPADVDLGLRYLTEFAVVVLADPVEPAVVAIVAEAARWGEAMMVLIVPAGASLPDGLPPDVVVFEAPDDDPDGVFADLVGGFAAALDEGTEPAAAFRSSLGAVGWTGTAEA